MAGTSNNNAATLVVTGTAAVSTAVTITLPAVTGLFHYITAIEIFIYGTATVVSGTPGVITTTNLPGTLAFSIAGSYNSGSVDRVNYQPAFPLRSSSAGVATTIIAPIATSAIWRVTAHYYTDV